MTENLSVSSTDELSFLTERVTEDGTEEANLSGVPGGCSISLKLSDNSRKALCKITYGKKRASGFLVNLGHNKKGLITCHHVINKEMILNPDFEFKAEFQGIDKNFTFKKTKFKQIYSMSSHDFTFMEFDTKLSEEFLEKGAIFLDYELNLEPSEQLIGKKAFIVQHPAGREAEVAIGFVVSIKEFHLFHSMDTEPGSSGSPVMNDEGKVMALHNGGYSADRNRSIKFDHIMEEIQNDSKKDIFAKTIWAHACDEPIEGQMMVASVLKERAAQNKSYWGGSSIEDVCKQHVCWNGKNDIDVSSAVKKYNEIRAWSDKMYDAPNISNPKTPDHYYDPALDWPDCVKLWTPTEKIGKYQFVRCYK